MTIEEVSWEVAVATEDNEEAMEGVVMEEVVTSNVVDMAARVVSVEATRVVNITTEDMVVVAEEAMLLDQVVMVEVAVEAEASRGTMKIQYLLETLEMLISVLLKTSSVGLDLDHKESEFSPTRQASLKVLHS